MWVLKKTTKIREMVFTTDRHQDYPPRHVRQIGTPARRTNTRAGREPGQTPMPDYPFAGWGSDEGAGSGRTRGQGKSHLVKTLCQHRYVRLRSPPLLSDSAPSPSRPFHPQILHLFNQTAHDVLAVPEKQQVFKFRRLKPSRHTHHQRLHQ